MKGSAGLVIAALLLSAHGASAASRIVTTDQTVIIGDIERFADGIYYVRTPFGVVQIPQNAIRTIDEVTCTGAGCQRKEDTRPGGPLRLAGSNTIGAKLAPELLKSYAESRGCTESEWIQAPDPEEGSLKAKCPQGVAVEAELFAHGSGTAVPAILANKADIGMLSRRIEDAEVTKLATINFGNAKAAGQEHTVALDGILVLVNSSNPVSSLSLDQIQSIFAGEKTNWADFGGRNEPIHIYSRDDKSGTYDTFRTLVLRTKRLAGTAKRFESSSDLSDSVAGDSGGIGFAGFAYKRSSKPLRIALDCGLAYSATEFLVKTEEYPLARRLFMYTAANAANGEVPRFMEFALSSKGQPTVTTAEFINLQIENGDPTYGAVRVATAARGQIRNLRQFQEYARAMNGERLSVTFRFDFASAQLDTRAVRDIDRLVEYLKLPENANRQVSVIGFADSRGSERAIQRFSEERAAAVATALRARGLTRELLVGGFGATGPVACNSTPEGAQKNRRVEIWLN